jgi:hypothetical protein
MSSIILLQNHQSGKGAQAGSLPFVGRGPDLTPNCVLWLIAGRGIDEEPAASNLVYQWLDQSGWGHNAIQETTGDRPVVIPNEINGKPVVRFNGSTWITVPGLDLNGEESTMVFVVFKTSTNNSDGTLVSLRDSDTQGLSLKLIPSAYRMNIKSDQAAGGFAHIEVYNDNKSHLFEHITEYPLGSNELSLYIDSDLKQELSALGSSHVQSVQETSIGRFGPTGGYFTGDIAEILIYTSADEGVRQIIENYLRVKYQIGIEAPGAPTGLLASLLDPTTVQLNWTAPVNPGSSPIISYNIYRKSVSSGVTTAHFLTNTGSASTTYNDTVSLGVNYYYKVSAQNSELSGPLSNEASVSAATVPEGGSALTLLVADVSNERIDLNWNLLIDDGGSPVIGFRLYRATVPNAKDNASFITTIGVQDTYVDLTVGNGITYYYQVAAQNSLGFGNPSNEVSGTPVAGEGPGVTPNCIGWWKADVGVTGDPVSSWVSQEGYNKTLTSPGGQQPDFVPTGFNGRPCLSFAGGDYMSASGVSLDGKDTCMVFVAFKGPATAPADSNDTVLFFGDNNESSGSGVLQITTLEAAEDTQSSLTWDIDGSTGIEDTQYSVIDASYQNAPWVLCFTYDSGQSAGQRVKMYIGPNRDVEVGVDSDVGTLGTIEQSIATLMVGAQNISGSPATGTYFQGCIAEIIIYDQINETIRQTVMDYLIAKYNATSPVGGVGPQTTTGAFFWYDATYGVTGNPVIGWTDKSGTGNNLGQTTPNRRPTVGTIGAVPTIVFDDGAPDPGVPNQYLEYTTPILPWNGTTTEWSFVFMGVPDLSGTGWSFANIKSYVTPGTVKGVGFDNASELVRVYVGHGEINAYSISVGSILFDGTPKLLVVTIDLLVTPEIKAFLASVGDGSILPVGTAVASSGDVIFASDLSTYLRIGSLSGGIHFSEGSQQNAGDLVLYDHALSGPEMSNLLTYFNAKY